MESASAFLATKFHRARNLDSFQLYLPREWADDKARRKKAHVPASIRFKTKPQIALEQVRAALLASVPPGVVLMDAGYGNNGPLRQALKALGLTYVVGIQTTTKVRPVREDDPKPPRVSVEALALSLPKRAWRTVAWREGTNRKLRSRFAQVRVRVSPIRGESRFAEETLLIEWPKGEANGRQGRPDKPGAGEGGPGEPASRRSLTQLRKELVRRGQVVSMTTLRKWRANNWTRKGGAEKPIWARDAAKALEISGLSDDVIAHIEQRLQSAADAELAPGEHARPPDQRRSAHGPCRCDAARSHPARRPRGGGALRYRWSDGQRRGHHDAGEPSLGGTLDAGTSAVSGRLR
jgi:hypothetical protein